jgi:Dirigent-like protein
MENINEVDSHQEENCTFKTTLLLKELQKKQIYGTVYLHHNTSGPNQNQAVVVNPNRPYAFGVITVNDWPLYDGLGSGARVIARARGLHVQAAMSYNQAWYNTFSIVFEGGRYMISEIYKINLVFSIFHLFKFDLFN